MNLREIINRLRQKGREYMLNHSVYSGWLRGQKPELTASEIHWITCQIHGVDW